MKSKLKLIKLFFTAIALSGYLGLVLPQVTHAATPGPSNPSSINSLFQGQICAPDDSDGGAKYNIARCVNNIYLFAIIIGSFIAVGMFVVAGYSYAMGTHEDISRAKSIINSTIIGLVLLFGTYAFLNTIDPNLTKIPSLSVPTECKSETTTVTTKEGKQVTIDSCASEEERQAVIDGIDASVFGDFAKGTTRDASGKKIVDPEDKTQYDLAACANCSNLAAAPDKYKIPLKNPTSRYLELGLAMSLSKAYFNFPNTWRVTEAWPPTSVHKSTCHLNGSCSDIAVIKDGDGKYSDAELNNIKQLCSALKAQGITIVNEYFEIEASRFAGSACPAPTKFSTTTGGHLHVRK